MGASVFLNSWTALAVALAGGTVGPFVYQFWFSLTTCLVWFIYLAWVHPDLVRRRDMWAWIVRMLPTRHGALAMLNSFGSAFFVWSALFLDTALVTIITSAWLIPFVAIRRRHGRTVGELRPDRLAGCLRTPQGGSSVQFLVDCRSGAPRIRPLTGREYARLQGADSFPIKVNDRQARLGFGDAVCVQAVRWLVHHAFDSDNRAALSGAGAFRETAAVQYPYAPPTSGRDKPQRPLFK